MTYLIHYAEIALKGGNRPFFENKLLENIAKAISDAKIKKLYGRILVEVADQARNDTEEKLSKIFGIANFAMVEIAPLDINKAKKLGLSMANQVKGWKTFKVETKRSNKNFPHNSQQTSEKVGEYILENIKDKKVKMYGADLIVNMEITDKEIYISTDKKQGSGGLPVGSSGKVIELISSGIDSPVASWMMAKRGVNNIFVHFHSFPYTKKDSIENVKTIIKKLSEFGAGGKLYLAGIGDLQKELLLSVPKPLLVIFYRRFMIRIAQEIAKKEGAIALATGENLGQVASQTLENMSVIDQSASIPIFRPLLAFDKKETIDIAKKIGTYDISILPYEDCCSLFVPEHPETKAKIEIVLEIEKSLDVDGLIKKIIENIEVI